MSRPEETSQMLGAVEVAAAHEDWPTRVQVVVT